MPCPSSSATDGGSWATTAVPPHRRTAVPGYIVVDGGCGTVLGTWPVPGTPVGPVSYRAHREDQHARRRRLTSCCGAGGASCATACGASSWPCACGAS